MIILKHSLNIYGILLLEADSNIPIFSAQHTDIGNAVCCLYTSYNYSSKTYSKYHLNFHF